MPVPDWVVDFETARRDLGLSFGDLWYRYFALGGMATSLTVEAFLFGALVPNAHDLDLLAVALNERYAELGYDHPARYNQRDAMRRLPPQRSGCWTTDSSPSEACRRDELT